MDVEIFRLNKQTSKGKLVEFLNESSSQEIAALVKEKLDDYNCSNDVDTVLLLRSILIGSPIEGGYIERRFMVVKSVIAWLSNEEREKLEKSKQASSVVNLILPEIDLLPRNMLKEAAMDITGIMNENKPVQLRILDLFSKIWNVLSATDQLNDLSDIFQSLLEAEWNHQLIVGISSALNEMELTSPQLEIIVKHMTRKLTEMEMEGVPPFIYQLLLLSRKGHKRLVLNGILDYFNSTSADDASRMEGTVMLHITFAIKQDKDLGDELVKLIKNNKSSQLELFNIACLLSAARIHRLQDTIFDLFKSSIVSIYKDKEKSDRSLWISKYSPLDAEMYRQVLLDVVEKSASGWDQVVQSLTQLSLILMDSSTNNFGHAVTTTSRSYGVKGDGPHEQVANLGVDILLRLFKYHDVVRGEILEQITSRIVSRSDNAKDFLRLLENIIREYPDAVENYLTNIKDTLDFLSFLPLATAQHLLAAIQPIAKTNEHFRDGLILVLRKSLFAKDTDGRQMAVGGFLNILNDQLTEIASGENDGQATAASEGVAFEILGLLRRCFSQQCEIRTSAYQGLGSLSQQYPSFAGDIFELLYAQFVKNFERDPSSTNPIKLEVCVENATNGGYPKILEPIHILLANTLKAMNAIHVKSLPSVTRDTLSLFKANMKSFVLRLSRATLEDFELLNASSDMATHIGLRNTQYASLLVAMEYEYTDKGLTKKSSEMIGILYKKRKALMGLLTGSTNDKGKKNSGFQVRSCVSLDFISTLLLNMFSKEEKDTPAHDLRKDIDMVQFIVTSTCDSLRSSIDDEYSQEDDRHFKLCVDICQTYMHILTKEDSDSTYANQNSTKKAPSVLVSIAASILSIFEIVNNVWPKKFVEFLNEVLDTSVETNQPHNPIKKSRNRVIVEVVLELKEVVTRYLSGRTPIYKEVSGIMHITSFLIDRLDKKNEDYTARSLHVVKWLNNLARERPIEDSVLAKDIMSLLIRSCASVGELDHVQSICEDIHLFTGDLEMGVANDSQIEPDITYQIINLKTFSTITTQIFEFLDSSLDDLTWCTGRLKLCAAGPDEDKIRKFEKEYCKRLISLMIILSELVKAVLTDVHAESLFKTLVKAYRTLHTFVKYKIVYPQDISPDFINVISKAGTEITERMYKFLTVYGQSQQQENVSVKKKGKKKEVNLKQRAKIQRESRMIPNLIFAVEQFERHLIQLSRKSRVDFMQYMKRSTSRDFKIQMSLINQESSEEEEEDEKAKTEAVSNDSETEENEGPSTKRARRDS
ncbi:hypothetical protein INT47_001138 [Mucor saturninus]|uniref:Fanconi anemia group I protein n=1 Tax=Mucor saturninus TaxID=64648 RepID=A0A8H7RLU4_9FUNG|nr:hypothetical protein INT47_001138 [Mucor saturninus]